MAMIQFEDHNEGRRAFLHYLETGQPPEAKWRVAEVLAALLSIPTVIVGAVVVAVTQ